MITPDKLTVAAYQQLYPVLKQGDSDLVLCEIMDIDIEELEDMDIDTVNELTKSASFIYNPLPKISIPEIIIEDTTFSLMPFNRIEFGAFIDIEHYIKNDFIMNLHNILAILYRVKQPTERWSGRTFEPYGDWMSIRPEMFQQRSIYEVYGAVNSYIQFRENLLKSYKGLFSSEEELPEEEEVKTRMTSNEAKEIERQKRTKKWGYELFLLRLAKNDPLRVSEAAGLGLTTALNLLSLMEELEIKNT
jgi:hypothetical protein